MTQSFSVFDKIHRKIESSDTQADLLVVTKRRTVSEITPFLERGHRLFGENRVQEAAEKWPDLKTQYPDIALHLIGPLQTNKIKQAVDLFDVIETLDREKLALKLCEHFQGSDHQTPCYIQVNTGEEEQKSGIAPRHFSEFLKFCQHDCHLNITGVMCIPPVEEAAGLHFALLSDLARAHDLPQISMGMSADFETALAFGSTQLRIGSALFEAD